MINFKEKLDPEVFNKYLNSIEENTVRVLKEKSVEYSRNGDSMHNFNRGAVLRECSREDVIDAFRAKHIISINDIRNDLKDGILPSRELLDEKFIDAINYYILEYASMRHRLDMAEREELNLNINNIDGIVST